MAARGALHLIAGVAVETARIRRLLIRRSITGRARIGGCAAICVESGRPVRSKGVAGAPGGGIVVELHELLPPAAARKRKDADS
jgi:hypothetical protein